MTDTQNHHTAPAIKEGYGHSFTYYRWLPYKPAHRKQSKKLGRWQKLNNYGGFENCEAPGELFPEPIKIREVLAERDALSARVAELEAELVGALAVIKDAASYTHSGDPWEENTFNMGELDLHHYVRDGRYDKAIKVGKSND